MVSGCCTSSLKDFSGASDLSVKFCNELERGGITKPISKIAPRPLPTEGMSIPLVVLNSTDKEMGDQGHMAIPTPTLKVTFDESLQQALCLIEPRGRRGRHRFCPDIHPTSIESESEQPIDGAKTAGT